MSENTQGQVAKKRGRPAGTRSPETIAAEKAHAEAQLVKLNARRARLMEELATVDEKISGFQAVVG